MEVILVVSCLKKEATQVCHADNYKTLWDVYKININYLLNFTDSAFHFGGVCFMISEDFCL